MIMCCRILVGFFKGTVQMYTLHTYINTYQRKNHLQAAYSHFRPFTSNNFILLTYSMNGCLPVYFSKRFSWHFEANEALVRLNLLQWYRVGDVTCGTHLGHRHANQQGLLLRGVSRLQFSAQMFSILLFVCSADSSYNHIRSCNVVSISVLKWPRS